MKSILILFFISIITTKGYCQNKEELAIQQLLEKESSTWRTGDIQAHAECCAIKPYSRILVSTIEGNVIDVPPDLMINPPAGMVGKGGSSINTNYKMSISGNNAWVSHNEESTAKDGTKSFTYEFRMLEKINNQWKLVGQSIHAYRPK
jgi:hypothetical protein